MTCNLPSNISFVSPGLPAFALCGPFELPSYTILPDDLDMQHHFSAPASHSFTINDQASWQAARKHPELYPRTQFVDFTLNEQTLEGRDPYAACVPVADFLRACTKLQTLRLVHEHHGNRGDDEYSIINTVLKSAAKDGAKWTTLEKLIIEPTYGYTPSVLPDALGPFLSAAPSLKEASISPFLPPEARDDHLRALHRAIANSKIGSWTGPVPLHNVVAESNPHVRPHTMTFPPQSEHEEVFEFLQKAATAVDVQTLRIRHTLSEHNDPTGDARALKRLVRLQTFGMNVNHDVAATSKLQDIVARMLAALPAGVRTLEVETYLWGMEELEPLSAALGVLVGKADMRSLREVVLQVGPKLGENDRNRARAEMLRGLAGTGRKGVTVSVVDMP